MSEKIKCNCGTDEEEESDCHTCYNCPHFDWDRNWCDYWQDYVNGEGNPDCAGFECINKY